MMTYQKILNNLPPKANVNVAGDGSVPMNHDNAVLVAENQQLSKSLRELRGSLSFAEQEILSKEHEILNLNNRLLHLEAMLQRYEYLTGELVQVESLDEKIFTQDKELNALRQENEELKKNIGCYKGHVQTLFLILIIVAIT